MLSNAGDAAIGSIWAYSEDPFVSVELPENTELQPGETIALTAHLNRNAIIGPWWAQSNIWLETDNQELRILATYTNNPETLEGTTATFYLMRTDDEFGGLWRFSTATYDANFDGYPFAFEHLEDGNYLLSTVVDANGDGDPDYTAERPIIIYNGESLENLSSQLDAIYFICDGGENWIGNGCVCDEVADCMDGSDEVGCDAINWCDDNTDYDETLRCDGFYECINGADEAECD